MLNGILLGQASHVVDTSGVCQSGIEVAVGNVVGTSLSFGLIARTARAGASKLLARIRFRPSGSIWNMEAKARGFAAEEKLFRASQLLGRTFPTIDRLTRGGTAVSIKSIDLTAKSYQSMSRLRWQLNSYVDELVNLGSKGTSGVTRSGRAFTYDLLDVKKRQLLVAIEPGTATLAQRQAIRSVTQRASSRGIEVVVRTIR